MKIQILCSSSDHPIDRYLRDWRTKLELLHDVDILHNIENLVGGDILFLVSCAEFIPQWVRDKYKATLVLHASDLPRGRGWSPHVWELIEGAKEIFLCLIEAEDKIDSGRLWKKIKLDVPGHYLWNEVNHDLFEAEIELMEYAVDNFFTVDSQQQLDVGNHISYRQRTANDSELDPNRSIAEQFNKLRMCDPNRYPAFFKMMGHKYKITIEKVD